MGKSSLVQEIFSRILGKSIAHKQNNTILISYLFEGNEYQVYLPFERKLVNKMINSRIQLEIPNQEIQEIMQQPGIPYFISPSHLGATSAKIYSISQEKTISTNEKIDL
jgi:hypothetical protein